MTFSSVFSGQKNQRVVMKLIRSLFLFFLGTISFLGAILSPIAQAAPTDKNPLILILTTPDLSVPPAGYTTLKTLSATAELPTQIHGPLDNPALKLILQEANQIHASALLGLNCQTNGRTIACSSIALTHDFSAPSSNIFDSTAQTLFGKNFYTDPLLFPSSNKVGNALSITFYLDPSQYRTVAGENLQETNAWWGLKKQSITVKNPSIPALCIDSLYFLKQLNAENSGLINFNCYVSTSALPGYVQINVSANGVQ
jgi:hypothetical protein